MPPKRAPPPAPEPRQPRRGAAAANLPANIQPQAHPQLNVGAQQIQAPAPQQQQVQQQAPIAQQQPPAGEYHQMPQQQHWNQGYPNQQPPPNAQPQNDQAQSEEATPSGSSDDDTDDSNSKGDDSSSTSSQVNSESDIYEWQPSKWKRDMSKTIPATTTTLLRNNAPKYITNEFARMKAIVNATQPLRKKKMKKKDAKKAASTASKKIARIVGLRIATLIVKSGLPPHVQNTGESFFLRQATKPAKWQKARTKTEDKYKDNSNVNGQSRQRKGRHIFRNGGQHNKDNPKPKQK